MRGYLYKGFTVHGALKAAYVYYECDNAFDLFINKRAVGVSDAESSITDLVQEGYNTVHIRVYPDQSPGTVHFGNPRRNTFAIYGSKGRSAIYLDHSWEALRVGNFYEPDEPEDWLSREDYPRIEMVCDKIHHFFLRHSFYFKKRLIVKKTVSSAVLYASAKGLYKAFVNGNSVSDNKFVPGAMEEIYEYQEYDIRRFLDYGENTIGFITGNGWYNCRSWGELTAKKNMIWFRVKLAYTDGTSETVSSDDSCFIAFSPLADN